jgi:hypothetical protein
MRRLSFASLAPALLLAVLVVLAATACGDDSRSSLTFLPDTLPEGTTGQAYQATTGVSGNSTPVETMSIVAGELPPGLRLSHERGQTSATIEGRPREAGRFEFTIAAYCLGTNVSGQSGKHVYVIVVK